NDLTSDLPPFIITVKGNVQKGNFNAYQWLGAPDIAISFPDNVPDLGFRPMSFWQRHLWQPIESQIREAMVILNKFLPDESDMASGLDSLWQKIRKAGSVVQNTATDLFDRINEYFQNTNTGASLAGFIYQDPLVVNLDDYALSDGGLAPPEQLTIPVEPTKLPKTAQNKPAAPDQLATLQAQLNDLLERIDDIAEETETLLAQQSRLRPDDNTATDSLDSADVSATETKDTQTSPYQETAVLTVDANQTQTPGQSSGNQTTTVPPPAAIEIIISEVRTESQDSAKDEYIELYNPNNFTVNLGGFILRKKTSNGSESSLVSSSKFQGSIAAFGYFLITPQSAGAGDLSYSSAGYYIAQTNSILLYDKYERLLDKAENVVHPSDNSFGRKLTGLNDSEKKYQQTRSSAADFEIQIPTPGADNQTVPEPATSTDPGQSTTTPDIPATTTPATSTPATTTPPVLLISEIQTGDASSTDNDFIEIFNPNDHDVDISDFQLKKQTSTGTSTGYSLCVFPASSTIPAKGHFLWANADYQMPDNLVPDITRASTISPDNSVALFDASHENIIDQVAWGSSASPFVETTPFSQNPPNGQTITRKQDESDNYIDNDNNADDFSLAGPTPTNSQGQTIQPLATTTPATTTPATSTPATSTPAFDSSLPIITDLQAAPSADRNAVDLWWIYMGVDNYLINHNGQTIHFTPDDIQQIISATIGNLTGGVAATFTVQYITTEGATSGPSNIATAVPLPGFQDNGDGTVSDLYSGLMWPKDGAGLAANNGQGLSWTQAKDYCEQLEAYGYDDWRLANIKELGSIIKYQKSPGDGAMIDSYYFQNIASGNYWSSSFKHFDTWWGWNQWFVSSLDLGSGFVNTQTLESTSTATGYFLPVRGDSAVIPTSGFDEPQTGCAAGYQANDSDASFIDLCSGLMWTPSFSGDTTFWAKAMENALSSDLFGHNDWRLPNIREMLMIINNPYQGSSDTHWAITPDCQSPASRWIIDFASSLGPGQTQTVAALLPYHYYRFVREP
ncbi:MAG: DUF1566 domain-containing protein, partial [Candidatus Pacebacteria bacterium]|nr:DUF1566 domain-containing protein [Candidatus Paceibacterota bacterium]